jgi:Asp-tRNA(Asn)/Glu-tRNA(Gln) amidotransferase B subunit
MRESIVIPGLTTVDRRELEGALSESEVDFDENEVRPGDFGELATLIATVLVTKVTLAALAIWASGKNPARKVADQKRYVFRQKVTAITKAGTTETVIEFEAESKEALQEGLAKQLAGLFQLDVAAVLDALIKLKVKA